VLHADGEGVGTASERAKASPRVARVPGVAAYSASQHSDNDEEDIYSFDVELSVR
jgi:hypothetical protein